ncbi:MAG: YccF domain-containing protein [Solirubrobacterales bacterium]
MRLILNIIWLIFSGIWLALLYVLAGIIMCVLIITIPFGLQAFKLAGYALWPFGRTVIVKESAGVGSAIGNILWLILIGWWLTLAHIITALALFITIIGIPLALGNLKLIPMALWPMGREVVPSEDVEEAYHSHGRYGQKPAGSQ